MYGVGSGYIGLSVVYRVLGIYRVQDQDFGSGDSVSVLTAPFRHIITLANPITSLLRQSHATPRVRL